MPPTISLCSDRVIEGLTPWRCAPLIVDAEHYALLRAIGYDVVRVVLPYSPVYTVVGGDVASLVIVSFGGGSRLRSLVCYPLDNNPLT